MHGLHHITKYKEITAALHFIILLIQKNNYTVKYMDSKYKFKKQKRKKKLTCKIHSTDPSLMVSLQDGTGFQSLCIPYMNTGIPANLTITMKTVKQINILF